MAERLFYADSFLTNFDANVTDIRERSREGGHSVWQIALDRTGFYPTSGGQPHDLGTLAATSPSGAVLEVPVAAVEEDEAGEIWHLTTKPLLAGTAVRGAIDRSRRLDHMQQHSGQHLLSAIFDRELSARTVSFHLGEESSTIDLNVGEIAAVDLERVESIANSIVTENRPVTQRIVPAAEAQTMLADGRLRKLPPRDGDLRVIDMDGVDLNACGGTHVQSTGQIGSILLRSSERVRQGLRISFVCGGRAVRMARTDNALLTRCAADLSASRSDLPKAIERLQAENKSSQKERAALRGELADYHAARLLVEDPVRNGRRVIRRVFPDRDLEYVKLLAARLTSAAPQTIAALASTLDEPAAVVLARSQDLEMDCSRRLKEVLAAHNGRGGGSPSMAQGQIPRERAGEVLKQLDATG